MRTEIRPIEWGTTAVLMLIIFLCWGLAGAWDAEYEQSTQQQTTTATQEADSNWAPWEYRDEQ